MLKIAQFCHTVWPNKIALSVKAEVASKSLQIDVRCIIKLWAFLLELEIGHYCLKCLKWRITQDSLLRKVIKRTANEHRCARNLCTKSRSSIRPPLTHCHRLDSTSLRSLLSLLLKSCVLTCSKEITTPNSQQQHRQRHQKQHHNNRSVDKNCLENNR